MRTEFLMYFCVKSSIGTQGGWLLVKCFKPRVVYSTDRSKAVAPVLVFSLLLCGSFYEAICFKSCRVLFCSCVVVVFFFFFFFFFFFVCLFFVFCFCLFVFCCFFFFFFFCPFSIAITSVREERANLSAFRILRHESRNKGMKHS